MTNSSRSFLIVFVSMWMRGSLGSSLSSESSYRSSLCSSPSSAYSNMILYFLLFIAMSGCTLILAWIAYLRMETMLWRQRWVNISSVIKKFLPSGDSKISFATSQDGILTAFTKTSKSKSFHSSQFLGFWGEESSLNFDPWISKNYQILSSLIAWILIHPIMASKLIWFLNWTDR